MEIPGHDRLTYHTVPRFHTFLCHSEKVFKVGKKVDFSRLVLMLWAANFPLIYYGFICDATVRIIYWAVTSFSALCCLIFTFQSYVSKPRAWILKGLTFSCLVLSVFIPIIHGLSVYGLSTQIERLGLRWIIYTIICDTFGAAAHMTKVSLSPIAAELRYTNSVWYCQFPESFFPRTFDLFGSSHQIMHIMILAGCMIYTVGLLENYDFAHSNTVMCPGH